MPITSYSVMPPLIVVAFVSDTVISISSEFNRRTMSPNSFAGRTISPGDRTLASMVVVMPISRS